MTCGIYKLNFDSEHFYIGKSINIEERWKQHFMKFEKGTAAKAMQACFDNQGYPDTEIISRCHPDHLDILEPWYIHAYYNSAYCLNSDRPTIHHSIEELEKVLDIVNHRNHELLQMSTFSHINEIIDLRNALKQKEVNKDLEIRQLKALPAIMDALDIQREVNVWKRKVADAEAEVVFYDKNLRHTEKLLELERKKSWWTKLWE